MEILIQVGIVGGLLILGFTVGSVRERSHFKSLAQREVSFGEIGVANLKTVSDPESVASAQLVMADCVIANDYFKGFVASWRNIFGGELKAYQTLMERARREAILRLLQQAREMGATEIWNIRMETSNVLSGQQRSPAISVEVTASATAITRR